MGNWKIEIFKFLNSMVIKKISHSRSNLFSNTPKKQSKRIKIKTTIIAFLSPKYSSEYIRELICTCTEY